MNVMETVRAILDALQEDVDDVASWAALHDRMTERGEQEGDVFSVSACHRESVWAKAYLAISATAYAAPTSAGRNACNCVQLADGYAETGYDDPACGVIAVGNWNTITHHTDVRNGLTNDVVVVTDDDSPERLGCILEGLGIPLEWEDEWTTCEDCGRLVRTSPDSYAWQPSYVMDEGELLCLACHAEARPPEEEEEPWTDDEDEFRAETDWQAPNTVD